MSLVNTEKSMALLPVEEAPNPGAPVPVQRQPRQPTSLNGLIRFSLEATKPDDAPSETFVPMDEERKKFLEEALNSMTIDVVEILQKQIKTLRGINHMTEDEVIKYLKALDVIMDYVDNIDTANDFHKIGGFTVLYPCLKSPYAKIRTMTCELVGILCQNNPYCQRIVLDNEFVPFLLSVIEKDKDVHVIIKAIYALGGVVRENQEGVNQFLRYDGLRIMLKCLKGTNDNVIIKTCFLLSSIIRLCPNIKDQLIKLGYINQLLALFMMDRCPSHEYVLSFLVTIMEDCPDAVKECMNFQYNVREVLHKYVANIKNKDYSDDEEYCRRILHMLNSER